PVADIKLMTSQTVRIAGSILGFLLLAACSRSARQPQAEDRSLVLALAVLGENDDGSPKPMPGQLDILTKENGNWNRRTWEDPASNGFHKAMAYGTNGLVSVGGSKAVVKLWRPDGLRQTLWQADFGGAVSRMRDAEIGNIYGDGKPAIAVATHDQGVVAVLR